jgi:uncharacterized protein involved in exopolysaccharide biosynthesis
MSSTLRPGNRYADYDAEIDIGRYLLALWRQRLLIAGATIVCGVLAFVVSSMSKLTYEATAQLIVSRSTFGETNQPPQQAVSITSFRAMLDNQAVAAETVKEFGLDKAPFGLTVSSLLGGIVSSEVVPGTDVITVKVRLPDPALAARVANAFAERAVKLAERLSQEDVGVARSTIKSQVDEAAVRLNEARARLETFKKAAQLDLMQADVTSLLNQRSELVTLMVDIESEKARLKSAEDELAKQEPNRNARTVLDVGGALDKLSEQERARQKADQGPPNANARDRAKQTAEDRDFGVRSDAISPYVDPVYEILRQQVATSRIRLAGLERRRSEMIRSLKLDAPQLARLSEMYSRQLEMERLETDYDLARDAYMNASTRYGEARLQGVASSARLQQLDTAVPPDQPVSRHRLRNAVIGLAAGLLVSALAVIALEMVTALGAARSSSSPSAVAG